MGPLMNPQELHPLRKGFPMISTGDIVEFSVERGKDGRMVAVDVTCLARPEIHAVASTGRGGGLPWGGSRRGNGGLCYNCGHGGHLARDCRQISQGRGVGEWGVMCYNCQQLGHLARNCSQSSSTGRQGFRGLCYNCGQSGHLARDCQTQESGNLVNISIRGYSGGRRGCYNCGEQSHVAKDCPNNND